jgi:membrane protease YdiL (CAAX protease family)
MSSSPTAEGPDPPARKGLSILAWLVIFTVVSLLLLWHRPTQAERAAGAEPVLVEMEGRSVVGMAALFGLRDGGLFRSRMEGEHIPFGEGLRWVVVAGEAGGPGAARRELTKLQKASEEGVTGVATREEERVARLLDELYSCYEKKDWAADLSATEREELVQRLGWFGELALSPAGAGDQSRREPVLAPARRAAVGVLAYLLFLMAVASIGLVLGVTILVLWLLGRLQSGIRCGSRCGGVYAETFAVYLVLFLGLSYLLGRYPVGGEGLLPLRTGLAALGSLAAVAWPVLRGVDWRRVRQDIGWTAGRRPMLEPVIGAGCYAGALPLVFVGAVIFAVLTLLARRLGMAPVPPTHPVLSWVVHCGWWGRLQVGFVACVAAPLVEETMFRGFLYRHLREATARAGAAGSVLLSAAVSAFIFAVIHPQGVLFVPILMALAVAFALAREWRGTLVPTMVAHAINNGLALLVLLFTLG